MEVGRCENGRVGASVRRCITRGAPGPQHVFGIMSTCAWMCSIAYHLYKVCCDSRAQKLRGLLTSRLPDPRPFAEVVSTPVGGLCGTTVRVEGIVVAAVVATVGAHT